MIWIFLHLECFDRTYATPANLLDYYGSFNSTLLLRYCTSYCISWCDCLSFLRGLCCAVLHGFRESIISLTISCGYRGVISLTKWFDRPCVFGKARTRKRRALSKTLKCEWQSLCERSRPGIHKRTLCGLQWPHSPVQHVFVYRIYPVCSPCTNYSMEWQRGPQANHRRCLAAAELLSASTTEAVDTALRPLFATWGPRHRCTAALPHAGGTSTSSF